MKKFLSGQKLMPLKAILILVFLAVNFNTYSQSLVIPISEPTNGFEIDGNTRALTAVDWFNSKTNPLTGKFIFNDDGTKNPQFVAVRLKDAYDGSGISDTIFSGSKFVDPPTSWKLTTGKPSGKGDINNVFFHYATYQDSQYLFIAADRKEITGSSYIDFEFLQDSVAINGTSFYSSNSSNTGGRSIGDIVNGNRSVLIILMLKKQLVQKVHTASLI